MGRVDKRAALAKKLKAEKLTLSKSAVAKTLAVQDKTDLVKMTPPMKPLILDKPAAKAVLHSTSKVTKKDKMRIKKDQLKRKLEAMQVIKKEEKASKQRKQKAIIGDIKPITDTLDTLLAEDEAKKKAAGKTKAKVLKPVKQKKVKEQMMKDLAIFQQVLKHPQYNQDPFNTISTHVENKMLLEAAMEEESVT